MPKTTKKTIHLDSAKLFRCRTTVAEVPIGTDISFLNPVEIRSGTARLGWASLSVCMSRSRDSLEVNADLVFSYNSPERLSIETESQRLFARPEGIASYSQEPFETVGLWAAGLPGIQALDILGLEITDKYGYVGQPHLGEGVL